MKSHGHGGGDSLVTILGKVLKPVVPWKSLLKAYVGSALSPEKEYRIGAKKHLYKSDDYLKRGLRTKKDAIKKAFIIVDASGSMFSQMGNKTIFDRVMSASLGGGTNFQAPLDYLKSEYHDAVNLVVFLTDGVAPMPKKPKYAHKFIWLVYDDPKFVAPFGKLIKVTMEDL
jgi:predicted metal-dependent peptidase